MYRNLTVLAAAAFVSLGFSALTNAEPFEILDPLCIIDAKTDVMSHRETLAEYRNTCDMKATISTNLRAGFVRPDQFPDASLVCGFDDETLYVCLGVCKDGLDSCTLCPPSCN